MVLPQKPKKNVMFLPVDRPIADFTFSGNTGTLTRRDTFSNQYHNADSYVWRFTGGSPAASGSQNPSVTNYRHDSYSVTLTAQKNGRSLQMNKVVSVNQFSALVDTLFLLYK